MPPFFLGICCLGYTRRVSATPFLGGEFRRLRAAGTVRRPGAGAKREGHLRFPSLFELLPFPQRPRERVLRPYFISNSHIGTVSAHVFLVVAALLRQIARVLRNRRLQSANGLSAAEGGMVGVKPSLLDRNGTAVLFFGPTSM